MLYPLKIIYLCCYKSPMVLPTNFPEEPELVITSLNILNGFDPLRGPFSEVFIGGTVDIQAIPVPPALWLFGSGLLGLVGIARRKKAG
jgi:hypothetical protein